jgi:cytochrome P450
MPGAAATSTAATRPLVPPAISPPKTPLPLWRFLPTFVRNPLRTLPEAVYHEPIFAPERLGGRVAWVTDPDLVERVLLGEAERFPKSPVERRIFAPVLGDGILVAEGQSWRWQRRTAAPVFRHADLLATVPAMSAAGARAVEVWRRAAPGRRTIDRDMTDATFDVLQSTIFAGATAAEADTLKRHIGAYLKHTSWEIGFEMVRFPAWVWHPGKPAMRRSAAILNATMLGAVKRERAAGWPGGGLMARIGRATNPDTGTPMSDALVVSNLLTFAAAGHETTAKALTWTLYLLARAPDWQDRVRAEVRAVAGDAPIAAEHLDRLAVTRQVLEESMRLYPPAPVMGRMTTQEVDIGGQRLKAGAMIVIPIWAIHRHRRLWDEPDTFDPTRFAPERKAKLARTQYMPFGFGPRLCIGMSFAMLEGLVLLATLVRAAHVGCDANLAPEPVSRVTLRPRGGMPLDVRMA